MEYATLLRCGCESLFHSCVKLHGIAVFGVTNVLRYLHVVSVRGHRLGIVDWFVVVRGNVPREHGSADNRVSGVHPLCAGVL